MSYQKPLSVDDSQSNDTQSGSLVIIVALVMLLIGVGVFVFMRLKTSKKNETSVANQTSQVAQEEKKDEYVRRVTGKVVSPGVYENETENFKFSFPSDWNLKDEGTYKVDGYQDPKRNGEGYSLSLTSPDYSECSSGDSNCDYTNTVTSGYIVGIRVAPDANPGREFKAYILEGLPGIPGNSNLPEEEIHPQKVEHVDFSRVKTLSLSSGQKGLQFTWAYEGYHLETIIPFSGRVYFVTYNFHFSDEDWEKKTIRTGGLAAYQKVLNSLRAVR